VKEVWENLGRNYSVRATEETSEVVGNWTVVSSNFTLGPQFHSTRSIMGK